MANRVHGNARPMRAIEPRELYERLKDALGVESFPSGPIDVVRAPFPDITEANFRDRYLLREVLRKYPGFELGIDTKQVALQELIAQEGRNRETNRRISDREYGDNPYVRQAYSLAREKISDTLGPYDPDRLVKYARFGPRATTKCTGANLGLDSKLSKRPHVTREALPLAQWYLRQVPMWEQAIAEPVDSLSESAPVWTIRSEDRVTCIPKNATTDRTVTPQPCFNGLLQLGQGGMLREQLARIGVDLNDQSKNQLRARLGSITGQIATVDLRNASNSISSFLVYDLVGNVDHGRSHAWKWYTVMDTLRTTSGWIGNVEHEWALFSSMGNGFTFELETLIFHALTCAACSVLGLPEDVSTYGDDITCPVEVIPLLVELFAFCGFTLNAQKSFWSIEGPIFRESCGKHYLDGVDVTPFYVDYVMDSDTSIVLLANNLVRWASLPGFGRDGRLKGVWDWIVGHLSERAARTHIPFGESNDGLIKDFDEACPRVVFTSTGDQIVQSFVSVNDGESFSPEAMTLKRMRLGYRAVTVSLENRPVPPDSVEASCLIWHYLKDTCRYSPLKPRPALGLPAHRPSWFERLISAEEYQPYRKAGLKESIKWSTRVVASWPTIGPWVLPDPVAPVAVPSV